MKNDTKKTFKSNSFFKCYEKEKLRSFYVKKRESFTQNLVF